ncbi:MAG TPA: DUF4214 domain-containing protein, partial [Pyrinomonadaceae bacterium]|nr:DUF4214 domain-containing protein [Pyrinomonadaceae bacterium]
SSTGPFVRISNFPIAGGGAGVIASSSRSRFAFSRTADLGFDNPDFSSEAFYQLSPAITTESTTAISLVTGASSMSVPIASPTATPSPSVSPTPTPSPSPSPSPSASPSASPVSSPVGLAAGELAFVQGTFGPVTNATVDNANASESKRVPSLPIELNGVSVSVGGSACGLYSVSSSQIKFVVPPGLNIGVFPIAVNNNGTVFRGAVQIVASQPDIFTSTNGPLGRAVVCNATNPAVCTPEPFTVTTDDGTGNQVATVLQVSLTGIRHNLGTAITATVGTTVINGTSNAPADLPGTDLFTFVLPSTVDVGDLPIVITSNATSSRDTSTAPNITINAGGSSAPNPIDTTPFFVRQQYLDFLNREPDPSGYAFWQNEINSCGTDLQCIEVKRINVSASFFVSIEFQQTGYLVYRTYKAAYGNMPNAPVPLTRQQFLPDTRAIGKDVVVNQEGWQNVLEANKQSYFASFVTRPEFLSKYQNATTAQAFVDALYNNAGITPTSAPNRAAALNEFNSAPPDNNTARAHALRLVAEDGMLYQQEFNKAFVLMEYFGYLQRNPYDPPEKTLDYSGYTFWLGKLNQVNGDYIKAEMVKAFISSDEYRKRFAQ